MENTKLNAEFILNVEPFIGWMAKVFNMEAKPLQAFLKELDCPEDLTHIFDVIFESRYQMITPFDTVAIDMMRDERGNAVGAILSFSDGSYQFSVECGDDGLIMDGDGFALAEMLHTRNLIDRKRMEETLPGASQAALNLMLRLVEAMPLPKGSEAEGIARCVEAEIRQFLMPDLARVSRKLAPNLVVVCEILDRVFDSGVKLQTAMVDMIQSVGSRPISNKHLESVFKSLAKDSGVLTLNYEYSRQSKRVMEIAFWLNLPGYDDVELFVDEEGLIINAPFFSVYPEENRLLVSMDYLTHLLAEEQDENADAAFRHAMVELLASIRPNLPKGAKIRSLYYDMVRLLRSNATLVSVQAA